jgi:hypothetical protein
VHDLPTAPRPTHTLAAHSFLIRAWTVTNLRAPLATLFSVSSCSSASSGAFASSRRSTPRCCRTAPTTRWISSSSILCGSDGEKRGPSWRNSRTLWSASLKSCACRLLRTHTTRRHNNSKRHTCAGRPHTVVRQPLRPRYRWPLPLRLLAVSERTERGGKALRRPTREMRTILQQYDGFLCVGEARAASDPRLGGADHCSTRVGQG